LQPLQVDERANTSELGWEGLKEDRIFDEKRFFLSISENASCISSKSAAMESVILG
jgi:hypothetical protein